MSLTGSLGILMVLASSVELNLGTEFLSQQLKTL